ncbi:hypothetical protein, partial [Xanthomonas axonopodis]
GSDRRGAIVDGHPQDDDRQRPAIHLHRRPLEETGRYGGILGVDRSTRWKRNSNCLEAIPRKASWNIL